jgi:tubulin monoglycylase TTLL3/8
MFDNNFKPYLIEVNSNPSLEVSCSLLAKIFTSMLDNTFRIALDPIFPPSTDGFASKKSAEGIEMCAENRFDLIFDERVDGPVLWEKIKNMSNEKHKEVKDLDDLEESEEEEELQ